LVPCTDGVRGGEKGEGEPKGRGKRGKGREGGEEGRKEKNAKTRKLTFFIYRCCQLKSEGEEKNSEGEGVGGGRGKKKGRGGGGQLASIAVPLRLLPIDFKGGERGKTPGGGGTGGKKEGRGRTFKIRFIFAVAVLGREEKDKK